jgi:hypothetical protein
MPIYPFLALLAGQALQSLATSEGVWPAWRRYGRGLVWVFAFAVALFLGVHAVAHPKAQLLRLSLGWTIAYCGLMLALAAAYLASFRRPAVQAWRWQIGVLALFLGVHGTGIYQEYLRRRSIDIALHMERVRPHLDPLRTMYALGPVHHQFVYYLGQPIKELPVAVNGPLPDLNGVDYFCFSHVTHGKLQLPFAWEKLGQVPVGRFESEAAWNYIVVGRRLPGDRNAQADAVDADADSDASAVHAFFSSRKR